MNCELGGGKCRGKSRENARRRRGICKRRPFVSLFDCLFVIAFKANKCNYLLHFAGPQRTRDSDKDWSVPEESLNGNR